MATPPTDSEPATRYCLLGLIGSAIQASKSPSLHETEAAAQGIRCKYELIDLDERNVSMDCLPALLSEAERQGFTGLNVTYPCKQAVIPYLHELSPDAEAIGAVNTIVFRDGRRKGYNTDAWGFAQSFRRDMKGASVDKVAQIGAGGAGAAIAYALLGLGAREVLIFDLDHARAAALAGSLTLRFPDRKVHAAESLRTALPEANGIVNATPVGMSKHPGSAVPEGLLRPNQWVADIVYFPLNTALLQAARAAGCRTLDGGGMAVYQAVRAFELFTGRPANANRMRRHFHQLVAE
jgi:shikimate dehydrogenase